MEYDATMTISRETFKWLDRILNFPDPDLHYNRGESIWSERVYFENGYYTYIDVIADSDPAIYPCWSQSVLYDAEGRQLSSTVADDTSILGEWIDWDLDDNEYTVTVEVEND